MATKLTTPEARQAARENVLLSALASFCDKRKDRERLEAGAKHTVAVTVAGEVDGGWLEIEVAGELQINHDQTVAASTAPDHERLIGLLLEQIPVRKRLALLNDLPKQLTAEGQLPLPEDPELVAHAKHLLANLRQKKNQTRRGSVRFEEKAIDALR
jgi:hypothetical protein